MLMKKCYLMFAAMLCGCATLPENFSEIDSNEKFLKAVVTNNKPPLRPASYKSESGPGVAALSTNYNDVGGYGPSRKGVDPASAFKKLCDDRNGNADVLPVLRERKVVFCSGTSSDFLMIVFYGVEPAGFDTGQAYAHMHYISLYSFKAKLEPSQIDWIVSNHRHYIEEVVDKKYTINAYKIDEAMLTRELTKLIE